MNTKELIQKYNIKPNKVLGQNFLINKGIVEKMVKTVEKTDIILEIGPGLGIITKELAKKTKKVIAIEKDIKMAEILENELKEYKNIKIIKDDALKINFDYLKEYKIVANIPYYLTSPIIRKFLESKNPPKELILLVQKEVAKRICSKPPEMSILSIAVQLYSIPKIISYVSKNSFWPAPKVDSAIIQIFNIIKPKINIESFFEIVRNGFSSPRKQLGNNLPKDLLLKAGIDSKRRAETLSVEEWKKLAEN
ncbi:16S rRNA (adenine(1518)-N(6)/adenine(1519)-N(6))-dimethyltransferase RsmA [Patescibacteria group bacterium]